MEYEYQQWLRLSDICISLPIPTKLYYNIITYYCIIIYYVLCSGIIASCGLEYILTPNKRLQNSLGKGLIAFSGILLQLFGGPCTNMACLRMVK